MFVFRAASFGGAVCECVCVQKDREAGLPQVPQRSYPSNSKINNHDNSSNSSSLAANFVIVVSFKEEELF